MTVDKQTTLAAFVEELAAVVGTLTGAHAEVAAGEWSREQPWVATLTAAGELGARCVLAIDRTGAAALSRAVSGSGDEVEDSTIADLLRNAISQAAAALSARPAELRVDLTLATLEPRDVAPAEGDGATGYAIAVHGLPAPIQLAANWIEPATDEAAGRLAPAENRLGNRIDVILDIDLPVVVRFGHTEMPIRALSRLGPGSVIDLGRSPDDPVDILVSDRVVARGEVVIVGGNYGIRILDVTSQSERARSMEA